MTEPSGKNRQDLDELCINTIRTLAMDAVQKANSGHPGTPMALAPLAYTLWTSVMKYNPKNPSWFDRDRFVLSNGHASMLLYAMLYLTGYDMSLGDLKSFRQWGSKTPGHPEVHVTPGVETTTGPLGQGVMNSVGMAMAEAHLGALYNRPGHEIVNHYTYAFCGDGDLMEGASHEAASLAGHLGLGKLIWFYDDNHISIEGPTELSYTDNVAERFDAYNWHVQDIGEKANDLTAIEKAVAAAKAVEDKPSIIIVRTHIGYGAPNLQDTSAAHGAPLGADEVALAKKAYGWPEDKQFLVPGKVLAHMQGALARGARIEAEWNKAFAAYKAENPQPAATFEASLDGKLPVGWDSDLPTYAAGEAEATRSVSGKTLNAIAAKVPWLAGGSADLSPSTKTLIEGSRYFQKGAFEHRNFAFGVREHAMCGVASGMYLHGGIRPYTATFFVFTDYARPAMRLAALMGLPVINVMTHDSICVGEDGPTHQPIAQMASFRSMPGMCVIRPGDPNEAVEAWRRAMLRDDGPTILVLTRQKLPVIDREKYAAADGLHKGAYVLAKETGQTPDVILIGTGSELQLALDARETLAEKGVDARVVSMPSWELFRSQPQEYRDEVLPPEVRARVSVEAGSDSGWHEWVGLDGEVIGMRTFGASAPYAENLKHFGFTVENVVAKALAVAGKNRLD